MVTRDDQLKWLAENSGSFTGEYAVMSMHHIGRAIEQGDTLPPKPPLGVYFFTRQEWMNEKGVMQKIATVDNSWREHGDLPPVGCECEIKHKCWAEFQLVTVLAVTKEYIIVEDDSVVAREQYYHLHDVVFRPLRTERENAIDEMVYEFINHYGDPKGGERYLPIAAKLYDAGYRKVKP